MSHTEQLLDSVNLNGVPVITELFFPLNLRYHALHHLFPRLPYHNLRKAHHRLLAAFPAGSPYHQSVYPGFLNVASEIIHKAWVGSAERDAKAAQWFQSRKERYLEKTGNGV